jgi:GTPase
LALFDDKLAEKPMVVAFNKMDMPEAQERWPKIKSTLEKRGYEVVSISALTQTDLRPLMWRAYELVQTAPEPQVVAPTEIPVYRPEADPQAFSIERTDDGGYRVLGSAIERAAAMTYWEHEENVRRFQRMIVTVGIDAALRKAGIKEGDTVYIGEFELEWQD